MTEPPRLNSLDELRVDMRVLVDRWLSDLAAQGIKLRILETRRTWERQEWLYQSGRGRPGRIVTNLRGRSSKARHVANPGMATALDFAFPGPKPFDDDHPWVEVGEAWEALGGVWGGRWKMRDLGHIQWDGVLPKSS